MRSHTIVGHVSPRMILHYLDFNTMAYPKTSIPWGLVVDIRHLCRLQASAVRILALLIEILGNEACFKCISRLHWLANACLAIKQLGYEISVQVLMPFRSGYCGEPRN